MLLNPLQRRYSHPVDKTTGVRSDHTVILTAIDSAKAYPDQLRRVSYLDVTTRKRFKLRAPVPAKTSSNRKIEETDLNALLLFTYTA